MSPVAERTDARAVEGLLPALVAQAEVDPNTCAGSGAKSARKAGALS